MRVPSFLSDKRPAPIWLAIGATTVGLLAAYLLKDQCASHPWADSFQYRRLCYNDLQPLFGVRGVSKGLLPYVEARYEYPPLTGLFMDLMGRLLRVLADAGWVGAADNPQYFRLSSIFLAPFAYAVTLLLRPRVTQGRLMLWAIGSPLILYSFHNWDLITVAAAVWGIGAFERSRLVESGSALAVGASAKLYPIFIMPAAFLDRITRGDRKGAARLVVAFVVVFALINIPVIVAANGVPPVLGRADWPQLVEGVELRSPSDNGWVQIWKFHADRYPDFGTVWFWLAHHGRALVDTDAWRQFWRVPGAGQSSGFRDLVGVAGFAMLALGSLFFLGLGWLRRREQGGYPVVPVSLGIVCVFLLVSKVHSPQYALWVVPLLAMTTVPIRYAIAYFVADLAVYVSGFYWFTVFDSPAPAWKGIFEVSVLVRALALGFLAVGAARAARLLPEEEGTGQVAAAEPVS